MNGIERQLRAWLPAGFAVAVAAADEGLPITEAERALVARAVPRRRAEFTAGRWCAHQALRHAGLPAHEDLLPGPLGALMWPAGCIGAITHDDGLCAAVAGPAQGMTGIGIDLCAAERRSSLTELQPMLLADGEYETWRLAADPAAHLHRLFCAKEAVVKATSEHVGRFFDLREICVTLNDNGQFEAVIDNVAQRLTGHHAVVEGHALALATARTNHN